MDACNCLLLHPSKSRANQYEWLHCVIEFRLNSRKTSMKNLKFTVMSLPFGKMSYDEISMFWDVSSSSSDLFLVFEQVLRAAGACF